MKKILLIVLAIVLILSFNSIAFAKESTKTAQEENSFLNPIMPLWSTIANISASLDISGGTAYMSASISTYGADSVAINAYLQRYINNSWTTIRYYPNSFSGSSGSWGVNRSVSSGYDYRLLVYYYAYEGGSLVESTIKIVYDSY